LENFNMPSFLRLRLSARFCFLVTLLLMFQVLVSAQQVPSIGGSWSFAGRATSIVQDAAEPRKLVFINEFGQRSGGYFADSSTVIATDWERGLRGSLDNNGTTIRWANGTTWTRTPGAASNWPSVGGSWSFAGRATSIVQDAAEPRKLVFTNEFGQRSGGHFADSSTVIATDWERGLRGSLDNNGNTIRWANGTTWTRTPGAASNWPSVGGSWSFAGRATSIVQDAADPRKLVFINEFGQRSGGHFADSSTVIATDWERGLRGSLDNNGNTIRWANGTTWTRTR
jgi:hypothetical protein